MIKHFSARRFEKVLPEGRTMPLVLGCVGLDTKAPVVPKVVKAIGCPEMTHNWQLVAEIIGNSTARQMGIKTPEPCVVHIDEMFARISSRSLKSLGFPHRIESGPAAGCTLITPSPGPFTVGQNLSHDLQKQAGLLYTFDMLTRNIDRRIDKVNCAIVRSDIVAFDFELCFHDLFLKIFRVSTAEQWEPSRQISGKPHLFHESMRADPLSAQEVVNAVQRLTPDWWNDLAASLPADWKSETEKVGEMLRSIVDHAEEFAFDIGRSLL